MQALHLIEWKEFSEAEIENDAHVVGAKILRHLVLGLVGRVGMPGRALLRQLGFGLQHIAAPRAPMRMHVDYFHLGHHAQIRRADPIVGQQLPPFTLKRDASGFQNIHIIGEPQDPADILLGNQHRHALAH